MHNTRPIEIDTTNLLLERVPYGALATCKTCGRQYKRSRTGNKCYNSCGSCNTNLRRFKLKINLVEYKGGKCEICGYNRATQVLQFHHLDPSKKEFTIGGNHSLSLEKLKKEVDKCILLCSNCHGELHAGLILAPCSSVVRASGS